MNRGAMARSLQVYRAPRRFVSGNLDGRSAGVLWLQVAERGRVVSLTIDRSQLFILAERLYDLLNKLRDQMNQSIPTYVDQSHVDLNPLWLPIEEEFRVGTIGLGWKAESRSVVIELLELVAEEVDEALVLEDSDDAPNAVRVFVSPAFALAFVYQVSAVLDRGEYNQIPIADAAAAKAFISYRRDDSRHIAGRIADWLGMQLGFDGVFFDIDSVPLGVDFTAAIAVAVAECDVLLAVIGPRWTATDFVRLEIEAALSRHIPVIPILVDGAPVPQAASLPESLRPLVFRNALQLRHETFRQDMAKLLAAIAKH